MSRQRPSPHDPAFHPEIHLSTFTIESLDTSRPYRRYGNRRPDVVHKDLRRCCSRRPGMQLDLSRIPGRRPSRWLHRGLSTVLQHPVAAQSGRPSILPPIVKPPCADPCISSIVLLDDQSYHSPQGL
ncbi:hypothetical protein PsYK624_132180 [Phanerochaete sordida]|uniref:Uncharacterized protein n=1 Tax=Phanerochaete sordida TaxID=48140 RepID=A0A9P3GJE8_9APHY|nr:hypothetical protein PsYK624_132180 [Phanerochaete sordida]